MVVADLHVHTTNSDGTLTLETLSRAAGEAGIDVVAITDHDRLNPELTAPVETRDGMTVIHGIELRVETAGAQLDLLGYGVERTDALMAELDRLQTNRVQRARRIVDCVEDRLDVALDVAFEPGVGRPHIARAIAASSADYEYEDAFEHLIGADCPCYVARKIPSFERGQELLADAASIVGLAHPLRYDDPAGALARTETLDAVELFYPYGRDVDTAAVESAIRRHDLVPTGGSDAHDRGLGLAGLDADQYEQFSRHLGA